MPYISLSRPRTLAKSQFWIVIHTFYFTHFPRIYKVNNTMQTHCISNKIFNASKIATKSMAWISSTD